MKAPYFTKRTLSADIYLDSSSYRDKLDVLYSDNVLVKKGEVLDMLVHEFEDGRIYYTIFLVREGKIYQSTTLKNKLGKFLTNTGGMFALDNFKESILEYYKNQK